MSGAREHPTRLIAPLCLPKRRIARSPIASSRLLRGRYAAHLFARSTLSVKRNAQPTARPARSVDVPSTARLHQCAEDEVANDEHRAKLIQQKLDRLDDAFIYREGIDLATYERQRDKLREELTLVEMDRHGSKL